MVKINLQNFKPVQVRANGLILASGGHIRKEYPLHTKDVKLEGRSGVATFVWINTKHDWLSFAVMGKKLPAGLYSKGVLKVLRDKVVSAKQRVKEAIAPESCLPGDKGVDPMDEMEVETPAGTSDKKSRNISLNILS